MSHEREMDNMQQYDKVTDRVTALETRMAVAEANLADVKEDLAQIRGNTTWILRLIIGAIVLGVIAVIMKDPSILQN